MCIRDRFFSKRGLGSSFDINVQHLFKFRQNIAVFIRGAEHQHMVVARGADDSVGFVKEGIGALDNVTAAVMLFGGEIAERCLLYTSRCV